MSETKAQPRVIIFTTPTCSFCNAAKNYFRYTGFLHCGIALDTGNRPQEQGDHQADC